MSSFVETIWSFTDTRKNPEVAAVRLFVVLRNVEHHSANNHVIYNHPDIQREHRKEFALFLQIGSLLRLDRREDLQSVPE